MSMRAPARLIVLGLIACAALRAGSRLATAAGVGTGAQPRSREWTVFGHDLSNTRLARRPRGIGRRTVGRLTPTWTKDGLVGVSGTPSVSGGVAYFGDWQGTVWALA